MLLGGAQDSSLAIASTQGRAVDANIPATKVLYNAPGRSHPHYHNQSALS